jgi:hypothetical protein
MKRLLLLLALLMPAWAFAQWQTPIAIQNLPPSGGVSGSDLTIDDQANACPGTQSTHCTRVATFNQVLAFIQGAYTPTFPATNTPGDCTKWVTASTLGDAGAPCGAGGGGAFSSLTGGTNTSAAMLVGTGASLAPTGAGTLTANGITGSPNITVSSLTSTSTTTLNGSFVPLSAGTLAGTTGAFVLGDCIKVGQANPLEVSDAGSACGSGGGSGAFSSLTTGTNTTATMTLGTGGSLTFTGSGLVNANQINGAVVPVSATLLASSGVSQLTALGLGGNLAVAGGALQTSQGINAQTGTSYSIQASDTGKLITFNNAAATAVSLPQAGTTGFASGYSFDVQNLGTGTVTITPSTSTINGATTLAIVQNSGCTVTSDGSNYQISACTAASSGGGGSGAFGSLTSGTNTIAAMLVGTGATLGPTGSGTLTANAISGAPSATLTNLTVDGLTELFPGNGSGVSAASWTTAGIGLVIPTVTYTDTTATGTVAIEAAYGIATPTVAATNTGVTMTDLATLYLGAPVAGTHVTAPRLDSVYAGASIVVATGAVYAPALIATGSGVPAGYNSIYHILSPCSGLGLAEAGTSFAYGCATGWTTTVPSYSGATTFTVSGCGAAGSVTGTGTAGTFTVGTGAGTCTFTFTINGATGLTATHGWIANVDDITAHLHCTNTAGFSTTVAVVLCNSTVTTGDVIEFSAVPY